MVGDSVIWEAISDRVERMARRDLSVTTTHNYHHMYIVGPYFDDYVVLWVNIEHEKLGVRVDRVRTVYADLSDRVSCVRVMWLLRCVFNDWRYWWAVGRGDGFQEGNRYARRWHLTHPSPISQV